MPFLKSSWVQWWIYEWSRARLRARLWMSIDINVYRRILYLQRITNIHKIYNKDSWIIQNHNKGVRNFDLQTIRRAWDSEKLLALSPWVFHIYVTSLAFLPFFLAEQSLQSLQTLRNVYTHTHNRGRRAPSLEPEHMSSNHGLFLASAPRKVNSDVYICAQHTCMNICHECVVFKYWPFATFRQQNFCSRSCMTGTSATMLVLHPFLVINSCQQMFVLRMSDEREMPILNFIRLERTLSWFVGASRMTRLIYTCGMSCIYVWNDPSESICTKHEKFPRCARLHRSFCCWDSWCHFMTTLIHIALPTFFLSTLLWSLSRFSLSSLFLTLFSIFGLPLSLSQTCMHG